MLVSNPYPVIVNGTRPKTLALDKDALTHTVIMLNGSSKRVTESLINGIWIKYLAVDDEL